MQEELAQSIDKFCLAKIEPIAAHDDETQTFRKEIFQGLGELGLCGLTTSEKYGGSALGIENFCFVLKEIAKYSVSYSVTVSVSSMVQGMIQDFGTDKQKEKYLPDLASGHEIGSFCLSESSSGSDARAMKTMAKKVKGGYELNGSKLWISTAGVSKVYIVMANTEDGPSSFIVELGTKGFSVGKKEDKMGWRSSQTCEVLFDKCFVPKENVLGTIGKGFHQAMKALDKGRITIGAISVGLAERALAEATKFALTREQFGKPIFDFQGLSWMLSDMASETECALSMVEKAARLYDQGKNSSKLASIAKLKASDVAMKVTTDAVQVHGGVGYTKEYPVERLMRDAKVLQIVEGTNQIQKVVISRELKKEFSK